jgi:hypothetical protein
MEYNVKAGDRLQVRHDPFLADALVVEITDRGAIIDYTGKVTLVGYTSVMRAPDGTQLTETPTQGFIGVRTLPPGRCLASTFGTADVSWG